jgi:protocatechuate 3,4-dioxygenase beta subunit
MLTRKTVLLLMPLFLHCAGKYTAKAQIKEGTKIETRSTGRGYALCGSCTLPKSISSQVLLVSKNEPGEPITLSGTIYMDAGVTPDSGVILFAYQTDAGDYYHRPNEDVFHPRIAGWLVTGKDGRYEIRTIRPAPEILAATEPAHIHVHIFGNGMPEHFLHEFWFQGDSRIPVEDKRAFAQLGKLSPIVTLTKDKDGVSRGVRNIRVQPAPAWKYEKE